MKNKIWNILYQIRKMSYRNASSSTPNWVDITILKYEIKKETPKYFFIQYNKLSTYVFWENKVLNMNYWIKKYKKENVEMVWNESKEDLIIKLNKSIELITKDDDISENQKKQYILSYNLILDYLANNNF